MKLRPMQDWAVILPSTGEEMTAGGLYIPDTAKTKPQEGVVEAIGPGAYEAEKHGKKKEKGKERKFIPTSVKPGDHVIYERYAGQTYKINGEERILVDLRQVHGERAGARRQGRRLHASSGLDPLRLPSARAMPVAEERAFTGA